MPRGAALEARPPAGPPGAPGQHLEAVSDAPPVHGSSTWPLAGVGDSEQRYRRLLERLPVAVYDLGDTLGQVISELGCRLALDDFGTGFSGFSYLKRLPVDLIKIDMEFVRDLVSDLGSQHVVQAVVHLARSFGKRTVAEGVEDGAVLDVLADYGVDYAQGFHLGRPAPIRDRLDC